MGRLVVVYEGNGVVALREVQEVLNDAQKRAGMHASNGEPCSVCGRSSWVWFVYRARRTFFCTKHGTHQLDLKEGRATAIIS